MVSLLGSLPPMTDKMKLNAAARYWADMVLEMEATHQRLDNSNTSRESIGRIFLVSNVVTGMKNQLSLSPVTQFCFSHLHLQFIWVDIWFRPPRELAQKLLAYHDNAIKSGQLLKGRQALRLSCRYSLFGGENLSLLKQTLHDRLKRMVSKQAVKACVTAFSSFACLTTHCSEGQAQ